VTEVIVILLTLVLSWVDTVRGGIPHTLKIVYLLVAAVAMVELGWGRAEDIIVAAEVVLPDIQVVVADVAIIARSVMLFLVQAVAVVVAMLTVEAAELVYLAKEQMV
jgi:hypothetical protein